MAEGSPSGMRRGNIPDPAPLVPPVTTIAVQVDLGPMAEFVLGSIALWVEQLPYGLIRERPVLRAGAERLAEALVSQLGDGEVS